MKQFLAVVLISLFLTPVVASANECTYRKEQIQDLQKRIEKVEKRMDKENCSEEPSNTCHELQMLFESLKGEKASTEELYKSWCE